MRWHALACAYVYRVTYDSTNGGLQSRKPTNTSLADYLKRVFPEVSEIAQSVFPDVAARVNKCIPGGCGENKKGLPGCFGEIKNISSEIFRGEQNKIALEKAKKCLPVSFGESNQKEGHPCNQKGGHPCNQKGGRPCNQKRGHPCNQRG